MTSVPAKFLWDTCVIYRWLSNSPKDYVDHIDKHLADARNGTTEIYISSVAFAEFMPSRISSSAVSYSIFSAVIVSFPKTILICTNLHWVMLAMMVIGSITLYGKREKGQFV